MSYNNTKLLAAILGYSLLACSICGCSANTKSLTNESTEVSDSSTASEYEVTPLDADDMFTDRDKEVGYDEETAVSITLADDATSCSDESVTIQDNTVTISGEGTYILSGSLSNGQIIIDVDENAKIQLVLDNASINCDTSAAIYVRQADKVFVTLASDSENTLSNKSDFVAIDDNNIDGVIFSKSDLTLNGSGSLTVNAAYGHGIVSKDDLVITSGTYTITAAKHALSGKDSVRIADGVITLDAGTDGIHSENTDKDGKGFIYIADGDINIESASDGMDAEETLQIDGGSMTIAAGDDGVHSDADLIITDGTIDVTKSYEGLEGMTITIEDGDINVVSSDDGLNAAGDPADATSSETTDSSSATDNSSDSSTSDNDATNTTPTSPAGDTENNTVADAQTVSSSSADDGNNNDAKNSDKNSNTPPTKPDGSNDNGGTPPEKPDSSDNNGGTPPQRPDDSNSSSDGNSSDNNASGDQSTPPELPDNADGSSSMPERPDDSNMPSGGPGGNGGFGGGGMDEAHDYNFIVISGGTLSVNANGDGIDSNGDLVISGGTIYVSGPTSGGDGALDYAGDATISSGTIIAVGASGMAQNFGSDSTQGSMLVTVADSTLTGDLTLTDSDGNVVVSYSPEKAYNSVVISCPELKEGETYTLTTGDVTNTVTMSSLIYGEDDQMRR